MLMAGFLDQEAGEGVQAGWLLNFVIAGLAGLGDRPFAPPRQGPAKTPPKKLERLQEPPKKWPRGYPSIYPYLP